MHHLLFHLDVDLATSLGGSELWYSDAQDTLLQTGLDSILIDTAGESKAAVELADRALADPELGVVLAGFDDILLVGVCCGNGRSFVVWLLILDSGFVGRGIRDSAAVAVLLVIWSTFVVMFRATFDNQSVWVGELDGDVFLVKARKFSVEVVSSFDFDDIELW